MVLVYRRLLLIISIGTIIAGCTSYSGFATTATHSLEKGTNNIKSLLSDDNGRASNNKGSEYRQHLISGDFDNDGYLDNAYAAVISADVWTLIIALDVLNDNVGEVIILEQHTPDVTVDEIRLDTLPPGTYTTFCGHMPSECTDDKPATIEVAHDAILLTVIEASASIVYFDIPSKLFKRVWLSD